jgi:hypothetical protein
MKVRSFIVSGIGEKSTSSESLDLKKVCVAKKPYSIYFAMKVIFCIPLKK